MWILTVYSTQNNIKMFEFDSEVEAREALLKEPGCKVLSEVIYFNDDCLEFPTV
ncbi:hypothetical protein J2Y03_000999 [Neobacillus niacini]|uniref:hypothetical protein n=1 Tax=Neobacillus niacini TaxID=86668 RepID=UPI00285F832D|nr:hypothetical protein [Neobacillus niacini]MDR7075996.1 hypothetical protein [Neobacillus niacini]